MNVIKTSLVRKASFDLLKKIYNDHQYLRCLALTLLFNYNLETFWTKTMYKSFIYVHKNNASNLNVSNNILLRIPLKYEYS